VIAIEYHADLKEVQSDARLAALLSPAGQSAPFDRLAWWQGLVRHCGLEPLLAVARAGDASAVLPLQGKDGHLTALANWYSFRVRPVFSAGADAAALLTAIAADLGKRAHRITLSGLPDEDGSATLVEQAFRAAGWTCFREACDANHVLALRGRSCDAYLVERPGKLRTTLRQKSAKVETEILTSFQKDAWDIYETIYQQSWKPNEGSPAFLRAFAEAEGAAGRLRLGLARAEGEAVAAQMWTVEGGTAFIHKLAHLEAARALSPGSVLSAAQLRHVIDIDRVELVDFGTGDDAFKRDWMEDVRPRYRLDMLRPMMPQNWLVFAKTSLRRLARRGKHG
jgi:CelD/BcsL family acetyltransferase involved in cellulose biosynthesis